ncbi:MAG TPA: hypothetical protein VH640_03270 [Bryobacteraceae bacterium]|jgi:hypothetical protein
MALQPVLPPEPENETFPKLVGILDTDDNFALGMAVAALDEAGIVYDIVPVPEWEESLKGQQEPKWRISPSRIRVCTEDEHEARSLVEPLQEPIPGEGFTEFEPDQS